MEIEIVLDLIGKPCFRILGIDRLVAESFNLEKEFLKGVWSSLMIEVHLLHSCCQDIKTITADMFWRHLFAC